MLHTVLSVGIQQLFSKWIHRVLQLSFFSFYPTEALYCQPLNIFLQIIKHAPVSHTLKTNMKQKVHKTCSWLEWNTLAKLLRAQILVFSFSILYFLTSHLLLLPSHQAIKRTLKEFTYDLHTEPLEVCGLSSHCLSSFQLLILLCR